MTGSGSFESYVSLGTSSGATPDGRLSGQPIASDCSPQPFPQVKRMPFTICIILYVCACACS